VKTILVIMSVLFAVGLVAGIVVPHESPEAPVLAAEEPNAEPPPNRVVGRTRAGAIPIVNQDASDLTPPGPLLTRADRGVPVPLADLLGVAGLLAGGVVTVLLLRGGRPDGGSRVPRPEVPRHQP